MNIELFTLSAQGGVSAMFALAALVLLAQRQWASSLCMGLAAALFLAQVLIAADLQWQVARVLRLRVFRGVSAVLLSRHTLTCAVLALQYALAITAGLLGRRSHSADAA